MYEVLFSSIQAAFFPPQSDSGEDDSEVRLGRRIPSPEETLTQQEIDSLVRELLDSYKDSDVTKDPFMSPALASDELLQGLPPVDVIVCDYTIITCTRCMCT